MVKIESSGGLNESNPRVDNNDTLIAIPYHKIDETVIEYVNSIILILRECERDYNYMIVDLSKTTIPKGFNSNQIGKMVERVTEGKISFERKLNNDYIITFLK